MIPRLYTYYTENISSNEVLFDETFSSALAYMSRPYSESHTMPPEVSYILYATS